MNFISKEELKEVFSLLKLSSFVAAGYMIQQILYANNVHFAGMAQDQTLVTIVGYISVIYSTCGGFFILGLNQAMGIRVGRCLGNGNHDLAKDQMTKGFIAMNASLCILAAFICNFDIFLKYLSMEKQSSIMISKYLAQLFPSQIAIFYFDFFRNILNAQLIYNYPMIIQLGGIIIHYCINVLNTFGFNGQENQNSILNSIVFSTTFATYFNLITLLVLALKKKQLISFSLKGIQNEKSHYAKEALMIAIPYQLDLFGNFNTFILSAVVSTNQFSAHLCFTNFMNIVYSFPLGLGSVFNNQISQSVGANDKQTIQNLINLAYKTGTIMGSGLFMIILVTKSLIIQFYTVNREVQEIMNIIIWIYMIILIFDCIQPPLSGVLKGSGQANLAFKALIYSIYCIGIPNSAILVLGLKLGIYGTWIAFNFGIFAQMMFYRKYINQTDWDNQIEKINEKLKQKFDLEDQYKVLLQ